MYMYGNNLAAIKTTYHVLLNAALLQQLLKQQLKYVGGGGGGRAALYILSIIAHAQTELLPQRTV